ncbi:MAG: long-chain fatty acid--CoA ligase, partial [Desulfobacterales bacterium]|nr:long-chain fatty acid--CoA ligase [Desulfobacterales bacterium]
MTHLTRTEAIALLSSPGSRLEVTTATIRGVEYRVPKSDFKDLHHLYAAGAFVGDETLLVYEDDRTSFTDAYLKAANLAWRLREDFGIEKGDRVAIASRNYPEW